MLIKTIQFHNQFLRDVSLIAIYKKKYLEDLSKVPKEKLETVGYGNQINKNLIFVGSYFGKQFGNIISDIDIIQYVNFDEKLVLRISDIIQNIDKTNFIFVRFYCGSISELNIPWKIDHRGSCNYDPDIISPWLVQIKPYLPEDTFNNISYILNSDSISISDLLKVESMIEQYSSLLWSKEELMKGYKDYKNKRYNLLESLKSTSGKTKVLKFIYKTFQNGVFEYCFVDCALKEYNAKRDAADSVVINSFYTNDIYQKVKHIKRYLSNEYREKEYKKIIKEKVGVYTSLAARIELIDKIKKYKVIDQKELNSLVDNARKYAIENKIPTIDYKEIQNILAEKVSDLYNIFRKEVPIIIRKGKDYFQSKKNLSILELRGLEGEIKIDKDTIRTRLKDGYKCPFFLIDIDTLEFLVDKCIDAQIDPLLISRCIVNREAIFKKNNLYIKKEDDKYFLKKKGDRDFTIESDDLKSLQMITLFY